MYTMTFEYDPKKSESNKQKHGINFLDVQRLWEDIDLQEIPAKDVDEQRFLVIGRIAEKYWSGVITYRGQNIRTPVNGKQVSTLFGTRLKGISALVITLSS